MNFIIIMIKFQTSLLSISIPVTINFLQPDGGVLELSFHIRILMICKKENIRMKKHWNSLIKTPNGLGLKEVNLMKKGI